jgi:hypothetical protein
MPVRYHKHVAPIGALAIGVFSINAHWSTVPEGRHVFRINDPPVFKLRRSDMRTILVILVRKIGLSVEKIWHRTV